ncbi:MAG TPA: YkgJ family cysteine cluster protein [Chitinophagaceae bacterium]|nr:YkgJ family cysteine cluster protein [Chitinophagaceae bacterium]
MLKRLAECVCSLFLKNEAAKLRCKREKLLLQKISSYAAYIYKMKGDLLQNWEKKSNQNQKKYKDFLKRTDKNKVLKALPALHEEAFEKIDCLKCANCCKKFSPRFKTPDIKRISRLLKIKEGEFIETYLRLDNDGDYVVRSTPCPFLGEDNYCSIYDNRPSDCHRFPYTDEDVLLKRPQLTLKNSTFCPIVYYVLEKLM